MAAAAPPVPPPAAFPPQRLWSSISITCHALLSNSTVKLLFLLQEVLWTLFGFANSRATSRRSPPTAAPLQATICSNLACKRHLPSCKN
ncbi:hypothetical protein GOP47_0012305 [Adiantum capillus-veneris]|uniref:Uncharacterized protein n=1 Tax=Adiantum capillus-veneris TaxID=13818 RepID=A0A9D4UQF2_ADICA|nr:hypothetical protein GOP47_0012305 [Adiantum capillus-veneris]